MESEQASGAVVVFTREQAARLAGMTVPQLDAWARSGLVEPEIWRATTPHRSVRLYDVQDLLAVLIVVELRARGISAQHIRSVLTHLRRHHYRIPELKFGVAGRRVFFQTPDGQWLDGHRPQTLSVESLDLDMLKARIQRSRGRSHGSHGKVEQRRGAMGSKTVLAGTRIPVGTIRRYIDRGYTDERILESYPQLTPADVAAVRRVDAA